MKEFMLYIRNARNAKKILTGEEHLALIRECEKYIGGLIAENKLIAAQPVVSEGVVISKSGESWKQRDIHSDMETQVGYYHIYAANMDEAIHIAKANPEFDFVPSATIEVRPVKTNEAETGFVYPVK
jgi:hypothetical protein